MSAQREEPVIVLYKSATCGACIRLSQIWDRIVNAIKRQHPNIRFFTVNSPDLSGKFDFNTAPKDIYRFHEWFPIIFLVPGNVWNAAMASLGPNNPIEFIDGIQIFNGVMKKEVFKRGAMQRNIPDFVKTYNDYDIEHYITWVNTSLKDPDFVRVSTSPVPNASIQSIQPIQPISQDPNSLLRPISSSSAPAPVVQPNTQVQTTMPQSASQRSGFSNKDVNICSMRIISRR